MRYGSVCSGIEAATVAWHPLGWTPAWYAEIEKFPAAVLAHHYPDTPNYGDMTSDHFRTQTTAAGAIDVLVGGTPCQSFSVAGLRGGLDDERGNLALEFCRLAHRLAPRWVVWENVPGVLSSGKGRDFGSIVGALVELGYGVAWRILDAQYFGVPQRRRRVFLVGHLGDAKRAAAVLFERHSLSGHPAPSRQARQETAAGAASGAGAYGFDGGQSDKPKATEQITYEGTGPVISSRPHCVAHSLRGEGFDASEDGSGRGTPLTVAHSLTVRHGATEDGTGRGTPLVPLGAKDTGHAIGFIWKNGAKTQSMGEEVEQAPTLGSPPMPGIAQQMQVRRLTPEECEKLQGFSSGYTRIAWRGKAPEDCPDGPRYKALGNSMAVPVMAWIGKRIEEVDAI